MAELFTPVSSLAMFHGFMGLLFIIFYSGAMVRLLEISKGSVKMLRYSTLGMTIAIWITSFTGLATYIFYRASGAESARSRILAGDFPWLHEVVFEFKEHAGMYPPIIMAVATLMVWHYGDGIFKDKKIKNMIAILLTLAFLLTLMIFGLGALVTKVEAV